MEHNEEGNLAWKLVLDGQADKAVVIFERLVREEPHVGDWNNYGTALLSVRDAVGAEYAFRRVRDMPHPYGYVSLDVGVALWLQGRTSEACCDWHEELNRIMTTRLKRYNSSGLFLTSLLWWAFSYLQDGSKQKALRSEIKAVMKVRGQQDAWGMAITGCLLGTVTPEELLNIATEGRKLATGRLNGYNAPRIAQAYFYLASNHLPHSKEWLDCLGAVVRYGTPNAIATAEYHISKYELDKAGYAPIHIERRGAPTAARISPKRRQRTR